jgi:hypothetical protein
VCDHAALTSTWPFFIAALHLGLLFSLITLMEARAMLCSRPGVTEARPRRGGHALLLRVALAAAAAALINQPETHLFIV